MKLVTAQQMRALEQRADTNGNPYARMMERAGTLTAKAIMRRWDVHDQRFLVLVGPGNNGGDGLVCARVLYDAGATVGLYVWKRELRDDDVNWRLCRERGIDFERAESDEDFAELKSGLDTAHFIVDALLGTGVARPIEGALEELLGVVRAGLNPAPAAPDLISLTQPFLSSLVNEAAHSPTRLKLIAVDLPTGLDPDTGALDPATLPADLTVTFAFPKVGHYIQPGAFAVGELVVADIGIPADWAQESSLAVAAADEIRARLPRRPRGANKGTFGKALLACGSQDFTGAPTLAAIAAGRVGAGLVTLAVPRAIYPLVSGKLNEATYLALPDHAGAWLPRVASALTAHARDYDALLVGCGLGRAETTQQFVQKLFGLGSGAKSPPVRGKSLPALVIDADALNALAAVKNWWRRVHFDTPPILTPHPGEMARLCGITVADVQADRIRTARDAAKEWEAIVVLKGAFTVIAAPDGRAELIPFANPALATAGTGDVLAGTIVGLLAQIRAAEYREKPRNGAKGDMDRVEDSLTAALLGAYIHARAGELVSQQIGTAGVLAGDLLTRLPQAIRQTRNEE